MKVSAGILAVLLGAGYCARAWADAAQDGPEAAPKVVLNPPKDDPRVDPEIRLAIATAQETLASSTSTAADKEQARAVLDERIDVIFDFSAPITVSDLAVFVNDGRGQVTYIYRFFHGWNGTIARGRIPEVAAMLSSGFRAVVLSRPVTIDPPPGGSVEIPQPPATVFSATGVDGLFTVEIAQWDLQLQKVSIPVRDEAARFFRLSSDRPPILFNPRLEGGMLTFNYRIYD